jgi:hypothetical protein
MANYDVATAPAATLAGTDKLYIVGKKHTTPDALKTYIGAVTPAQLATEQARILALEAAGYVKADGSVSFTARVGGSDGILPGDLATLSQVDTVKADSETRDSALWNVVGVLDNSPDLASFSLSDGAIGANESVKTALEKLEQTAIDIVALSGVARNDETLGTLAANSSAMTATETIKSAVQKLMGRIAPLEARDLEIGGTVRSGNYNGVLGQIEPVTTSAGNAVCLPPATGTLTDGVEFGTVLYGLPGSGFTVTVDFVTRSQTVHGRSENIVITDEITPVRVRWSATHASWFIVS